MENVISLESHRLVCQSWFYSRTKGETDRQTEWEWIYALGNILGCSKPKDRDWWQMIFEIEYSKTLFENYSLDFILTWKYFT